MDSAHKRIIWSVDFCCHDSSLLASGGRDGVVKIWKVIENKEENILELKQLHRYVKNGEDNNTDF